MTYKKTPRRTALYKLVRQKAHQERVLFRTALDRTDIPSNVKTLYSPNDRYPRKSGRTEGAQWNSSAFISAPKVDDKALSIRDEDVCDYQTDTGDTRHHIDMTVSLLDIASPAKRKGAAKDFEVVQKIRDVIALGDEFEGEGLGRQWEEDDDWERIYNGWHREERRSYSSVLRGNET